MHITTGLDFEEPQSDIAFNRTWDLLKQSQSPVFHAIGNHDLYNFKPAKLRAQFNEDGGTQVKTTMHLCHACDNKHHALGGDAYAILFLR